MKSKLNQLFKFLTKTRKRVVLILMMLCVDAYPCAFIYFNNIDGVNIVGAVGPFLLFALVSDTLEFSWFKLVSSKLISNTAALLLSNDIMSSSQLDTV